MSRLRGFASFDQCQESCNDYTLACRPEIERVAVCHIVDVSTGSVANSDIHTPSSKVQHIAIEGGGSALGIST